jgi:hypothetical protein
MLDQHMCNEMKGTEPNTAERPGLYVLVPDGVGIRNFVYGSFLRDAVAVFDVTVCHFLSPLMLDEIRSQIPPEASNGVCWRSLVPYQESMLISLLRYTMAYAHMCINRTGAMMYMFTRPVRGSWRRKLLHRTTKFLGWFLAYHSAVTLLEEKLIRAVEISGQTKHYEDEFAMTKPAFVFCSHQRPPTVLPILAAAKKVGIPTGTFIFSWDNLTSKGRMVAPFDYYFVWSAMMRDELLRFYRNIRPHRVFIIGTPQFDPYADPSLLKSREDFFREIGADPARKMICYTGGDDQTCPEDPQHVRMLMDCIANGSIAGNPILLVRPTPVDVTGRYDDIAHSNRSVLFLQPAWKAGRKDDWTDVIPLYKDVVFLANLTQHADVNINIPSTMTLDFAIHDTPVVNIAYDVATRPVFGVSMWEHIRRFEHYLPVVELRAARIAMNRTELVLHVNAYLKDSSLDRDGRRKLVEHEVGIAVGASSRCIVDAIERIVGQHRDCGASHTERSN